MLRLLALHRLQLHGEPLGASEVDEVHFRLVLRRSQVQRRDNVRPRGELIVLCLAGLSGLFSLVDQLLDILQLFYNIHRAPLNRSSIVPHLYFQLLLWVKQVAYLLIVNLNEAEAETGIGIAHVHFSEDVFSHAIHDSVVPVSVEHGVRFPRACQTVRQYGCVVSLQK